MNHAKVSKLCPRVCIHLIIDTSRGTTVGGDSVNDFPKDTVDGFIIIIVAVVTIIKV